MNNKEHICKFYKGKIRDVTFRSKEGTIHCRRCCKELEDFEVNPIVLNLIKVRSKHKK